MTAHDPDQLQRLLDRRGFLSLSGAGVAAALALPAVSSKAAPPRKQSRGSHPRVDASAYHGPYTLDADCVLSEDHFQVRLASIDPAKDEVVAYSWADGQAGAILLQDGAISQVYRDQNAPGGWNSRAVAAGATDLVAGMAADDGEFLSLHVFYRTAAGTVVHRRQLHSSGAPGPLTLVDTFSWGPGALQITIDQLQNVLVFCATPSTSSNSPNAKLWFFWTGSSNGQISQWAYGPTAGVLSGFGLAASGSDNAPTCSAAVSYAAAAFLNAPTLMVYSPAANTVSAFVFAMPRGGVTNVNANVTRFQHQPPPSSDQLVAVDYLANPGFDFLPTAVVRTALQDLLVLTHDFLANQWHWTRLTLPDRSASERAANVLHWEPSNTPVKQVLNESSNLLDLFMVIGGTLSVVRQANQDNPARDAVTPVFNPAVALQAGVAAMSSQARLATGDQLLVVSDDGNLQLLTTTATQSWTASEIHLPAVETTQISTYRVQLTLSDAWGTPVSGQALQISASLPATALINGRGLALSAAPVPVITDLSGRATLAILADGLFAPQLTVSSPLLSTPVIVSPSTSVNAYMSGTTSLNFLPKLDSDTLRDATIDNRPVAPLAHDDKSVANLAVGVLAGAAKAATNSASPTLAAHALGRQQRPATSDDRVTAHPEGPASSRDDTPPTEGTSHPHPPLKLGSAPPRLDRFVDVMGVQLSIGDLGKDALYAIKTGVAKVSAVVVAWDNTAKRWVATLTADFAAWGEKALDLTIAGLEDAAHVFHSVVNHLGALLGDFIDWLKAKILAVLTDSVALAQRYDGWLLQLADQLTDLTTKAQDGSRGYFAAQKSNVHKALGTLKNQLGTQTLATIGQPAHAVRGVGIGSGDSTAAALPDARSSWLLEKVNQQNVSATKTPTVSAALNKLIGDLRTDLAQEGQDFIKAADDFKDAITTLVSNPRQFAGVGAGKLIDLLGDVIDALLDLADLVADVALNLLKITIATFNEIVATNLTDLPLVGRLLKAAGMSKDLTVGGLVTLIIAFPTVLGYKLVHGADAVLFGGPSRPSVGPPAALPVGLDEATAAALNAPTATFARVQATVAQDLNFATGSALGLWAYFDLLSAIIAGVDPKGPPDFFAWIDMAAPAIIGALTVPAHDGGLPFTSAIDLNSNADDFTAIAWTAGVAPALFTAIGLYVSKTSSAAAATPVQNDMLQFTAFSGFISAAMGVLAAAEADSGVTAAVESILGNIGYMSAPALSTEAIEASDGVSAVAAGIIGFICSGITAFLTASYGYLW